MALSLKSRDGCHPNEKLNRAFERLRRGIGNAGETEAKKRAQTQELSEYETHKEKEMWSKLKSERNKDLVLMFGDDDVRVFFRGRSDQVVKEHDLNAVKLDKEFMQGVDPTKSRKGKFRGPRTHLKNVEQGETQGGAIGVTDHQLAAASSEVSGDPIPLKTWEQWIRGSRFAKNEGPKNNENEGKSRQRRHHRPGCKYHPYSTNSDFRRLSIQTSFPSEMLRRADFRRINAASGSSSGMSNPIPIEEYFARPELIPSQNNTTSASSYASTNFRSNSTYSGAEGGPEEDPSGIRAQSAMSGTTNDSDNVRNTFMTECLSAIRSRCQTPDLGRFHLPPRPHSRGIGEQFIDCDCTPRMSDEEPESGSVYSRPNQGLQLQPQREKSTASDQRRPPSGKSNNKLKSSTVANSPSQRDPHVMEKVQKIRGVSRKAERRLSLWSRNFTLAKVHARSCLGSIDKEREEHREFVCDERRHLQLITEQAESVGAGWRVSRQLHNTTPVRSSIWGTVHSKIGEDEERLAQFRDRYVAFVEYCESLRIPTSQVEIDLLEEYRKHCLLQKEVDGEFCMKILANYGSVLCSSKQGLYVLNYIREQAGVSPKPFFQYILENEQKWNLCTEVFSLQQKLITVRGKPTTTATSQ